MSLVNKRILFQIFQRRSSICKTIFAALHEQQHNPVDDHLAKTTTLERLEQQSRPRNVNAFPLQSCKDKSNSQDHSSGFVDCRMVKVSGGRGGDGMICFLALFCNPEAGPSGGDGGHGGHIVFEASSNINSLNGIGSSYTGCPGEPGMHKDMHGKNAEHTVIQLPIGTLIRDAQSKKLIADLDRKGIKFLAARGGTGGKGNHYFLNNQNRHPRVAEVGAQGEKKHFLLEMKIIAHAGLLGFPNAGKSTLLKAVSRAKPKVASYPFTTLKPTVGMIPFSDGTHLALADLPGLTHGAHRNRGLGIAFLRHVERCVCLFYVIDITDNDPYGQLRALMFELESYKKELSSRPLAIIVNKMDADGAEDKFADFCDRLRKDDLLHLTVIPISAKFNWNITNFLLHFKHFYDSKQLDSRENE